MRAAAATQIDNAAPYKFLRQQGLLFLLLLACSKPGSGTKQERAGVRGPGAGSAAAEGPGAGVQDAVRDEDIVIVMGTCAKRLSLAHTVARESRGGASGVRIVFALDNATLAAEMQQHVGDFMNETYLYWPDRPASKPSQPQLPGDTRVAILPWLAHQALGGDGKAGGKPPYKWLLYGDDDTFFFMPGLKSLIRAYDHNLPYVISGTPRSLPMP